MQGSLSTEVDQLYFMYIQLEQLIDFMGVQHVTGSKDLFLSPFNLCMDVLEKVAVFQACLQVGIIDQFNRFGRIKLLENLLTCIESDGTQEKRTKDTLLAVDLGEDQMLFIINLKLQPRPPVGDDPGGIDIFFI